MRISAVHRILSAMGGQLKIIAQFPDSQVVINQFDYLEISHVVRFQKAHLLQAKSHRLKLQRLAYSRHS